MKLYNAYRHYSIIQLQIILQSSPQFQAKYDLILSASAQLFLCRPTMYKHNSKYDITLKGIHVSVYYE